MKSVGFVGEVFVRAAQTHGGTHGTGVLKIKQNLVLSVISSMQVIRQ